MIVFAAIMPHPPESIPGIGSKEELGAIQKTLNAFDELKFGLEQADPDTIIIISPHSHIEPYSFVVNSASELVGSFEKFDLDESFKFHNNIEIADRLVFACSLGVNDIPAHLYSDFLDYGALIPLYHLAKDKNIKVVHLSFSLMNYDFHYRYGEIIHKIIEKSGSRIAVIASGDLSHRLTPNAPAGFSERAQEFDRTILHHLGQNDLASIMELDSGLIADAKECGLRSFMILFGILHDMPYKFNLLSYEGPFGVGYLTARLL